MMYVSSQTFKNVSVPAQACTKPPSHAPRADVALRGETRVRRMCPVPHPPPWQQLRADLDLSNIAESVVVTMG